MHLTILVPQGQTNLSSIVGAYKLFTKANEYWIQSGKKARFDIQLAGSAKKVEFHDGLFTVHPHTDVGSIRKTDLIIIPSVNHNYKDAVAENERLIDWIQTQYNLGAELASICTGAFMLAATGLMTGRKCSTHWSAADNLKMMFPDIEVQADTLITDEDGIYTNGGAYSFLNLMIYLIGKYYDRSTAIFCAKVFQIEIDRQSQSAFIIFRGQKLHGDELIKKAQTYIENRLDEKITTEQLSSLFAVGRRNFDRRFIKATGNTPIEYAQRVRIEAAKKAFETTRKTIHEVMYEVGYSDIKAFRNLFKRQTGLSPLEYRDKYNNAGVFASV